MAWTSWRVRRGGVWLAALGVFVGGLTYAYRFDTYHLATVHEGVLYRDGNRGLREFRTAVRKVRPRTVVMLVADQELNRPDRPQFRHEVALLRRQGVRLVHLPVTYGQWPNTADVRRFLSVVEDPSNHPVLVHCAQGVTRTGMMVTAYQESVLGWDDPRVKRQMLTFGHDEQGASVAIVRHFVDGYDGQTRVVRRLPGAPLRPDEAPATSQESPTDARRTTTAP